MTKDQLTLIVNQFDEKSLADSATFGIFTYGEDTEESYLKANRDGLVLGALYLLKAALKSYEFDENTKEKTVPFPDSTYDNCTTIINYIKVTFDKKGDVIEENQSIFIKTFFILFIGLICLVFVFGLKELGRLVIELF